MAHDGLGGNVGWCLGVLYANDGMADSRDTEWTQHAINVLVGLFRRYGIEANVANSLTMSCQPGALRSGMPEEDKALKCTGVGELYRVRLRRRIP